MLNYLDEFEDSVTEKIANKELDDAITKIVNLVDSILSDQTSLTKVSGSLILDSLCQKIGSVALDNRSRTSCIYPVIDRTYELVIYVATELYITGGHTAVIEDLIKSQPKKKHLILLTDIFYKGQCETIKQRFAGLTIDIEWATEGSYLDKLVWLQDKLIAYHPNQVFILNHQQDAIAIAAVQQSMDSEFIFYHHADYSICLGLYLSFTKHIDGHAFCYQKCHFLGVKNRVFIPLMAEDLGQRNKNTFLQDKKLRTCSSGSWGKYSVAYSYSYLDVVPAILSMTGGYHIHIGDMPKQAIDTIQTNIKKRGISPDNFIYIPWVKSIWEAMEYQKIDLYINSFPIGGSKAIVEVMGSGTPILGHQNYNSYLLSYAHTIYPEAFFWSNLEELSNYLNSIDHEILSTQANLARYHYESYHTPKIFIECLKTIETGNATTVPPLMKQYPRDELRAYFDDFKQLQLQLEHTQSQLEHTQSQLEHTQSIINDMKTSKFWKLQTIWCSLKNSLNLRIGD